MGEAAQLLGISASTLRRWADDGRVTVLRTGGGHRRFPVSELRRIAGLGHVRLRTPPMPSEPLPWTATLLTSEGRELAVIVARSLYVGTGGWFSHEGARVPTAEWIAALATAFAQANPRLMTSALARYLRSAKVGGASLAERHTFVERFGAAMRRRLHHAGCPPADLQATANAMAILAHQALADDTAR